MLQVITEGYSVTDKNVTFFNS